jgi:CRP/FNR family transcriptional regulator, cyclic AMP receptor protein
MLSSETMKAYIHKEQQFSDKDVICAEGRTIDTAFIILEGKIRLVKNANRAKVTVEVLNSGTLFGDLVLGTDPPAPANLIAEGDVTIGLLDVPKVLHDYDKLSDDHKLMIRGLCLSVRNSISRLCQLAAFKAS